MMALFYSPIDPCSMICNDKYHPATWLSLVFKTTMTNFYHICIPLLIQILFMWWYMRATFKYVVWSRGSCSEWRHLSNSNYTCQPTKLMNNTQKKKTLNNNKKCKEEKTLGARNAPKIGSVKSYPNKFHVMSASPACH